MKKKLIYTFILLVVFTVYGGQFEKAMTRNIQLIYEATTHEQLQAAINQVDRIGAAEVSRWEPYYYAAFGYVKMSGMFDGAEDKDRYLDLALTALEKGEVIAPSNSELEAMRGYIHMIKLTVDPASRGMTYSGMAFASFNKAIKLNPKNPRAHYLLGRMQHGTAQFMGGGNEDACLSLAKANELFINSQSDQDTIAPDWGKDSVSEAIAQICQ